MIELMPTVILLNKLGTEVAVTTAGAFVEAVYSKGMVPKIGSIEDNYNILVGSGEPGGSPFLEPVRLIDLQDPESPAGVILTSVYGAGGGTAGPHSHDVSTVTGLADYVDAAATTAKARANHTGSQSLDTTTDSATRLALTTDERTKIAGVAAGATANSTDATLLARANHTGTQSLDTTTDTATRVAMIPAERTKLTGVATGATANSPDATLLSRANHTGTQSLDTTVDTGTRVAMTPAERTKLTGVATGATANSPDATLLSRANHTGTQSSATISDLTEAVQDIVSALIVAGTNVTTTYDDAAGTYTINATASGGTTDPEVVRDTIGGALVAGSGIQVTVNDVGDTITIASTAVPPTRQVIAGTGLTGGGDLSADRTLTVSYGTTAGTAAQGNDSRITGAVQTTDARVTADQAAATASIRTIGTGALQAAAGNHGHTASAITDSTTTGRSVLTAASAAAARTAIGAGTSDLAIGTTGTTAKAGDYQPTAANISDSTVTGRSVLTAATAAAARTAIGAGTSDLAIGTTSTTAKAGDYSPPAASETVVGIVELATATETTTGTDVTRAVHPAGLKVELDKKAALSHTHTAANISDSTATGRSVLTATDAATARTAIGAGTSSLAIGTTSTTAKAGDYQPTAANISDSTATGRSLITAADAAAVRSTSGAAALSQVAATVLHDGTAGGGTRPTGYVRVIWVSPAGSSHTRPTNMVTGDTWEHDA